MEAIKDFRFSGYNNSKKKYIIVMKLLHDKLFLEAYSENDMPDKFYKVEKSYEELTQNKFLTIYENISEIFTAFSSLILDKESHQEYSNIIEEEKSILISIPLNLGKYNEFKIKLNE